MLEQETIILNAETIPRVEIDFMNNTHFEELEIVNKLGENIAAYQATDDEVAQISQDLQDWLGHTIPHFERENELMQKTGFPAYGVHSEEHEIALKRLKAVIQTWEDSHNIEQLTDYVLKQWPAWFNAHVSSMDMMTAKFAKMNGYTD